MLLVYNMALEALANPLNSLQYLPRGMNYAVNPADNDPYYSAANQYVKNDVVLSDVDGGAYIFLGGAADKTATRGGADPSADANWVSLAKDGVNTLVGPIVPTATGQASAPYVMAVNSLTVVPGQWLVTWQCTATKATATVAADWINWTLTSGANSVRGTQVPIADTVALSNSFTMSALLTVPTGATTIVLSGSAGVNSSVNAVSATSLVAVRVF